MNEEIYKRNIPDKSLKPNYDYRPISTKYVDINKNNEIPINKEPKLRYNMSSAFNPGYRGEVDRYFLLVDKESDIRNQNNKNKKYDSNKYVPETNSDLYVNKMNYKKEYSTYIGDKIQPKYNLAPNNFNNSTRYNVKNI